jgi:hypothetical protein
VAHQPEGVPTGRHGDGPSTLALPRQRGPRPTTTSTNPHRQIDQPADAVRLAREAAISGLPGVVTGPSLRAPPGTLGLFLRPEEARGPAEAFLLGTEFAHFHRSRRAACTDPAAGPAGSRHRRRLGGAPPAGGAAHRLAAHRHGLRAARHRRPRWWPASSKPPGPSPAAAPEIPVIDRREEAVPMTGNPNRYGTRPDRPRVRPAHRADHLGRGRLVAARGARDAPGRAAGPPTRLDQRLGQPRGHGGGPPHWPPQAGWPA